MPEKRLPEALRDLEPYLGWSLPDETARHAKRMASSIEDIREFYESVLARIDPIIAHLNQFPLDTMPAQERALLDLVLSLAEVSPAVEFYDSPQVRGNFDSSRMVPSKV